MQKRGTILAMFLSLFFLTASQVHAETDELTCLALKEKYKDCLKMQGFKKIAWYDFFGNFFANSDADNALKLSRPDRTNQTSIQTLSICNHLAVTLSEERCTE